ncbi:MAG: hypothetical protein EPO24_04060 [Bacteroidetes bacterium]|nr:MAG: hypothetical protein EPO24_04060 [Bacteroidota bacterium]
MVVDKNIFQKKGELQVARERRQELRISADVIVKGMLVLFDPMDIDCVYVDTYDEMKLKIYVQDLHKKRLALDTINKRIEQLEKELGANADE